MDVSKRIKSSGYKMFAGLFPNTAYRWRKRRWQQVWSKDDYQPGFRIVDVPDEIQEAVSSGWFQAGTSILDIGCGSGEIAAWLAENGFDVLGVDYARAAIDLAQETYRDHPGSLAFETVDILHEEPGSGRKFDALIDRGCLHTIPDTMIRNYVSNVAAVCRPNATFLLLYGVLLNMQRKTDEGEIDRIRQKKVALLKSAFKPYFNIEDICSTSIKRESGNELQPAVPGIAVWLRRTD